VHAPQPTPGRRGRFLAYAVIAFVVGGVTFVWLSIPQLTENRDAGAGTTTTTVAELAGPEVLVPTTTTSTLPPPVPVGGEVSLGVVGEPLSLNPLLTGGNAPVVETISELWTAGLFDLDAHTLDPTPQVATEIPTIDNGGLVVNDDGTMTVRYELGLQVQWEDGTPITGFDVAFTYEVMSDPALPIRPDLRDLHALIVPNSIVASASSVSVVLERPTIRFLSLFPVLVPVAQVEGSDFVNDWNETTWMSAGPFRFEAWEVGRAVRFVRNDGYGRLDDRGDPLPYLDAVEIGFFGGDDELLAAFRLQTVDAALVAADPDVLPELEASPAVDLQIAQGPEYEHLAFAYGPGRFEANPGSMNESVDFREFIARTLDRAGIVEDVFAGQVEVLNTVVGMSWPGAAFDGWAPYEADEALQADLLEKAVNELGREPSAVGFSTSASLERTQIAGSLLQRLAAVGLPVDIELLEVGEFFRDRVLPGTFDVGEWAWRATSGPVGAVADLEDRFLTLPDNGGYNFYQWGVEGSVPSVVAEQVQQKIAALDSILDLDELRAALVDIDALMAQDVVIVPMFAAPNAAAVWVAAFEGFEHVGVFPDTWNAAVWHRIGG
jgi:peptide/nickel transport system substrate-binding protein